MTYTQSAFGANFFYLDQILDRMPPISKFIDKTPKDKNLGKLTVLPSEVLLLVLGNPLHCRPHTISALQPIIKPFCG
jgi:hypothetical protein